MLLTDLEPQLVRRPPAVPACRGHEPASTERWAHGASNSLASRLCHTLLAAVRRHSSVQEANRPGHRLGAAAVRAGSVGTPTPRSRTRTMRTVRAHRVRCAGMHVG